MILIKIESLDEPINIDSYFGRKGISRTELTK